MLPKQEEWKAFYQKMNAKTGLDLDLYKANQLQRRILSMCESRNVKELEAFWRWLDADKENMVWFLDKLAINVSELFRNPERWADVEQRILPELMQTGKPLKFWSAGCSYGAEAHTLAVLLDAKFPGRHQILGSDIDEAALAQANRGEFNQNDMRGVPPQWAREYFEQKGISFFAKPSLKKYLTFRRQNLLRDRFDRGFDMILCRNVVIYFTDAAKDDLYKKFFEALRPGGYLFVGSTERIFRANEIGFESPMPFFYRKPTEGKQEWRNAS